MKKINQRGMADASSRPPVQTSKEGVKVTTNINEDLNSNKADSTPIFQSQTWVNKEETTNPITQEQIFRDLDMHENLQTDEVGYEGTEEHVDPHNSQFVPRSKSPKTNAPGVKLGLVRETVAKWVKATRPISPSGDLVHKTNLGKHHFEATVYDYSEANRRPKKSENACSQPHPTMEAVQQPHREQ
nr:hypothetical protein CFP56_76485 [Quercus suber]